MPNDMLKPSKKIFVLCVDDVFDIGMGLVSSKNLSVCTTMYWFLWLVFESASSMFIATKSSGLDVGNS